MYYLHAQNIEVAITNAVSAIVKDTFFMIKNIVKVINK